MRGYHFSGPQGAGPRTGDGGNGARRVVLVSCESTQAARNARGKRHRVYGGDSLRKRTGVRNTAGVAVHYTLVRNREPHRRGETETAD